MGANKRALSARWQGAALLVILGIATSWLVNPVAADAVCSEEEGPLSCEACREGADVNAVSGLPRMSFSGAFVSSNQGEFDWVKCTADECEYWNAEDASNNAPATSPASYLQSVGMFAAVSVVMAVLSPLFITCCCLWRMCGCCGGWTPTYWMTKTGNPRCCKCGFRRRLNPLLADEDKFAYPTLQVTLIRIFAICVAILLFVFIAVGQQMGNVAFTDSMERLALAPSDTVNTIRKLITPGHKLVVDIASHTLVPTMEDINKTLTDAIDIPVLVGAAQCIIDRAVVPPALQELVDAVLHIVNLKDTIVEMDPDVQRIFDQVDNVTTAIGDNVPLLDVLLDELEASKTNLTSKLTALVSDLGNLDTQVDKFLAPGTGIAAISHDIVNASSSESYPSSSQLSTTANGGAGTASIAQLIDPASPMVGVENSPQRTQLIDNLEVFAARFGALPNTTMTVYNLQALETVRSDMVQANTISTTDKLLYTISEDLKLVPASARADVPINAVLNALFALNTTEIRELVVFLNTTVNLIPNVEEFNGLVDDVFELAEILPCVDDVIPSILAVDEQILVLPSFVHEIRNMTVDVKKMIETARNQTREVGKQLEFVEVERKRIDFDSIDNMIDDIKSTKKSANESFSDVLTETKKLDSSKSFSFADIRGNLGSVQSTLENPDLTPKHSTLNALRSAEDTRITLYDLLVDVANSITTFAKGRCSGTTTACENDGECTGTCEFAQKQCSDTTATCTGESNDNSCPTGYCLFEKAKYETLQAALAGFSVPDFDAGSLQSQLDSLNNELKGLNLDAPIANVTDLKNDLNDVPIASAREKLSEVDAERARVDGNFSDVIAGWNGIKDNTDKIPAPDGVKKDLDSLQSSVKQLEDFRKQTTTFRDLLSALRTFLYETLPPLFDDMAPGVLNARFEKEGILGTYRAMIDFAKNITSFLSEQQQLFNNAMNSTSGNLTLTEDLDDVSKDIEPQLEVLSQNKYFENGPYYFLASIMDYDTVDPSYTGVDRVFFNKQGKRYPGDKLCVTKGCITNTVRFVNRKPLSEVMEAYNVSGVGVPLTREQMSGVPYIFPGITALLLFLVAVCRCPRKSRWQRCPTCLTGCCMFCTIPIAFFLAGFFFTFVVIGADTCRGGVNVGYQIMTQKPNIVDMCDSLSAPLSSNNAQACNMSVGDDYVDVDIPGMYSDLFGGCSSEQAAWNTMLSDLAGKYTDIPVREVNKTLNDMGDGEFSPRPNMKTNVLDGARRAGTAASNFIDNVNGVLSCSELNGDFAAYKEAICCDFMTAAYWAIGSWNLIAWIMCCCGVPACCLGYKRFPKRPWGSDYKSQINYERIAQQDKDREDQRLAGGAMLQMVHMAPSHPGAGSMASQQPPVGQPNPAWGHGKVDQPSAGTPPYQQLHHGKANNGKGQRLV